MGNKDARTYWTNMFPDIFWSEIKRVDSSVLSSNHQIRSNTNDYKLVVSLTSFKERLHNDAHLVIKNILEKQTM